MTRTFPDSLTPAWLAHELEAAVQEFCVNILRAVRATLDAELALYETPTVTMHQTSASRNAAARTPTTAPRALAAELRGRIVEFVRDRPGSSAHQIACAMKIHVGTVRPYLSVLIEDGLLRTEPGRPEAPGRPALVYFRRQVSEVIAPSDAAKADVAPSHDAQEVVA